MKNFIGTALLAYRALEVTLEAFIFLNDVINKVHTELVKDERPEIVPGELNIWTREYPDGSAAVYGHWDPACGYPKWEWNLLFEEAKESMGKARVF